uniref:Uncharacterized protein n=1 Tax=Pongo abelii TaxID=9601 RepID=H2P4Y2_PONAB
MGSKLTCCMGPRGGLNSDCCRPDVAPCDESEIPEAVAVAAPASTTAEPAKMDLGATEVQHGQYLSRPKIPKGPVEDLQASAHRSVENISELVTRISFSGREMFFVCFLGLLEYQVNIIFYCHHDSGLS